MREMGLEPNHRKTNAWYIFIFLFDAYSSSNLGTRGGFASSDDDKRRGLQHVALGLVARSHSLLVFFSLPIFVLASRNKQQSRVG